MAVNPDGATCLFTHCNDACDCPAPPPGDGNAVPICEPLLGDGDGDCFLDCSGGEQCPTGMTCFVDMLCVYPV